MFASRLDNASSFTKTEAKQITPVKSRPRDPKIVHDMAEYLFDIFDANLMEDYHIMERFENKAVDMFVDRDSCKDEYTFEQENLHKEFLKLFESLLDNFLVSRNITINQLLDEVQWYIQQDDVERVNVEALEIVEVLHCIYVIYILTM